MSDERGVNEQVMGDLCDDLSAISVNMRKWPYERLVKALEEVSVRYSARVAGHPVEEFLLKRRIAEWRCHFAHEHLRPLDEAEALLGALLADETEFESNIDHMCAFARFCLRQGDPGRGLRYIERASALHDRAPPTYVEHPRQRVSLTEIARLCQSALGQKSPS